MSAPSFFVGIPAPEAVARLAQHYPVFPCRSRSEEIEWQGRTRLMRAKTPLVARGFHEATQDVEQIRAWWKRWPDALAGVPTGLDTGLVVVDYDAHKADAAAQEWIAERADTLMATRSHTTLSGGRHYLFRAPAGIRYRSGASLILGGQKRTGIDVRAEGGYIIWWPLHGGSISGELAPLPAGLIDERKIEPQSIRPLPTSTPEQWRRDRQRVADALAWLEPDDYDRWIRFGMALHFASGGSDDGFALWHEWSAGGVTGALPANYGGIVDCQYRWASFSADGVKGRPVSLGSVFAEAKAAGWAPPQREVPRETSPPPEELPPLAAYEDEPGAQAETPIGEPPPDIGRPQAILEDFWAYLPLHQYLYTPTRELWPAASVNATVSAPDPKIKASAWLDMTRAVQQMTWAPAEPEVIEGRILADGGWINRPQDRVFNLYRAPLRRGGDTRLVAPWLDHIATVYAEDMTHIVSWLAHRVQRPGEKLNHALVLGGAQGIGKDSLLEPIKAAVGHWNFTEVSPTQLLGRFNGFLKCVILRVSEARDLGDVDRYSLYEHLKPLTAAPPDVLRVDEKHLREYVVMNVCGVIITTNHVDGIYLPPDDRRHYVAWSELTKESFPADYWRKLYAWYAAEGIGHVCEYLRSVDLSGFDPKAPPPKTAAWHRMVDAGRAPEDGELADALDVLSNPDALTVDDIAFSSSDDFRLWLKDRRNSRTIPHRLATAGYVPVRNDGQSDGRWKINGKNVVVYAKSSLTPRERSVVVHAKLRGGWLK